MPNHRGGLTKNLVIVAIALGLIYAIAFGLAGCAPSGFTGQVESIAHSGDGGRSALDDQQQFDFGKASP